MKRTTNRDQALQSRFISLIVATGMAFAATVTIPMAANANIVSLDDYNGPSNQITCTPSCEGFVGSNPGVISLSTTNADDYDQVGDPAAELALLNVLLGQFNPARPAESFVNKTDLGANSYSTSRQYFSIKQADNLWFFENTSGGEVNISALGDDWSHTTEYGCDWSVAFGTTCARDWHKWQ